MNEDKENTAINEFEEKEQAIINAGLSGATAEVVSRYGSANKEFLVGYSGVDNETSQVLSKSLKGISESKVNPDYKDNNIHQQAGTSAEVAKTARDNAKNQINKSNKRTVRTDDHPGYGKNDMVHDHVETINGGIISGSGSQMKFLNNPKKLLDKIACGDGRGKNDLSRYLGSKLDLPSDQVNEYQKWCENEAKRLREKAAQLQKSKPDEASKLLSRAKKIEDTKNIDLFQYCDNKAKDLQKQAERLQREGKTELAEKMRQRAKNYETLKKNIRDSGISTKEAEFYRLHPGLATTVDILKNSHRAGIEQVKYGAVIEGSISIIKNLVAVIKDGKEIEDAMIDVAKDTGSAAAVSYATAFSGSAIKGAMQNAGAGTIRRAGQKAVKEASEKALKETGKELSKQAEKRIARKAMEEVAKKIALPAKTLQGLSKTNLPATLVTIALETGKTLSKYIKGEIDGVECFEELGEKGTGMLSSAMFATLGTAAAVSVFGKSAVIGQIMIPIPVIGGMIGGMVGYALCSACYGELMKALKDAKIARQNRIKIEAECEEAVRMIKEYRLEIEAVISTYLTDHITTFNTAFNEIKIALNIGDIDGFISGANLITEKLGGKPQFANMSEFDSLMNSSDKLHL